MTLEEQFKKASTDINKLSERPSNEDLLSLYGLFKQATEGDNTTERPGGFDFKAAAKYNAWEKLRGTPAEQAMEQYIQLVDRLSA